MSAKGREVLQRASGTLKQHKAVRVIVEGHTDSDRIGGELAQRYPTNWELSAARSVNVIRYLASLGVDESRFEGRAFSSMRPVASNDSPEARRRTGVSRSCWHASESPKASPTWGRISRGVTDGLPSTRGLPCVHIANPCLGAMRPAIGAVAPVELLGKPLSRRVD